VSDQLTAIAQASHDPDADPFEVLARLEHFAAEHPGLDPDTNGNIRRRLGHRMLGTAELAAHLGISRELTSQWFRRAKLPEPDQRLAMGPVWRVETILAWERARRAATH
jgi:DNA-binding transcriptional regulator YiaG